jgi:hypothetical protein
MPSLIIGMVVVAVEAAIIVGIWWDCRRHPICPTCPARVSNFNSKRIRLFGKEAVCSVHGKFSAGPTN